VKKDRRAEMRIYEWDMTRWLTSRARLEMPPLGRYIYRELLDLAYAQGKVPRNHESMARYCDVSLEDFELHWPKMERYFHVDKHDPDSLVNDFATVCRTNYFRFCKRQSENRKKHGSDKSSVGNKIHDGGVSLVARQEEKRRDKKRREDNIKPSPTPPTAGDASPDGEAEVFALSPPEPLNGTAPSVRTLRNVQTLTGELLDGQTAADSPGAVRPDLPTPIRKTGPELIAEAAARIYKRHPAKRRCSPGEVRARLTAILRAVPQRERAGKLARIEANHAAWCQCEQWTKDGGEYAKGLDNWLAPTKGRFDEEPPPEVEGQKETMMDRRQQAIEAALAGD
jgi:hypothetical protein